MEELTGREQIPGEIVETYRRPAPQEVVETYRRPLPERMASPRQVSRRRRRRRKKGVLVFVVFCLLLAAAAGGAWGLQYFLADGNGGDPFYYDYENPEESASQEITIPTYPYGEGASLTVEKSHGEALSTQEIYRRLNPSVVTVMAQMEDGMSVGTGVIFTEDGYILTNYHVLEGGSSCTVTLSNDRTYEALYVAGDADNDLAVLKVDLTGLPAAEFGSSDELVVGDPVYAIGNPLGVELRGTLTDGIVSAINRDVWVEGRSMSLIQTNAALNTGNSGGPLINAYGQVVGINTIKMTSSYSNVEGLGFAIPSDTIRLLVNDLLTYGEVQPQPALGVSVSRIGEQLGDELWGILVQTVEADSAAEKAGVQVGDFITAANGAPVTSSQDLLKIRRECRVGDPLTLTLYRDGELLDVALILQAAEEES